MRPRAPGFVSEVVINRTADIQGTTASSTRPAPQRTGDLSATPELTCGPSSVRVGWATLFSVGSSVDSVPVSDTSGQVRSSMGAVAALALIEAIPCCAAAFEV